MKSLSLLFSLVVFAVGAPARADSVLQPNDVVAINGDSITAQTEYSAFIEEYLLACQSVPNVRSINFGVGGTTAPYFDEGIEPVVLPFKPTVATICYGMNDAHSQINEKDREDTFRKSLVSALKKLKAAGVRTILLGGPGCVDPALFHWEGFTPDGYNATLKAFSDVAADVAKQDGDVYVDVHDAMMTAMAKSKAATGIFMIAGDGVHPSANVHLVMAYAFLKAFGCDGAIGTITVDLGTNQAEGTPGQKIVSVKDGSVAIESTRYPFCFVGNPNVTKMLPFLPFNDELNRYMLIVNGLKTAQAKVTWGTDSKVFSAADLEKGINLADEFLNNPFCDRFNDLQTLVAAKQSTELSFASNVLHNLGHYKTALPAQSDNLDQIAAGCVDLQKKFSDVVANAVLPVDHAIVITPVP